MEFGITKIVRLGSRIGLLAAVALFTSSMAASVSADAKSLEVMIGAKLAPGFGMGFDDSSERRDWLVSRDQIFEAAYPDNLDWGAVFVTVGNPVPQPRPSKDFSAYKYLFIELKGARGDEDVEVGIKDKDWPDNGTESKVKVRLGSDWKEYRFPLVNFKPTKISKLYVVTELVFVGQRGRTVYFRNIRYE